MDVSSSRRRALIAAGVVASIFVAAGCGSSDDAGQGTSGKASDAASSNSIKVGVATIDTGASPWPSQTEAIRVAAKYLNAKGGIEGHPIELVTCDTKSEEATTQACGQKFANSADIPLVIAPLGTVLDALVPAVGGKPVVTGITVTPGQESLPNTYSFVTNGTQTYQAYVDYAVKKYGAKSIAFLHEDDAATNEAGRVIKAGAEAAGVSYKEAVLPVAASDILPQVTASGADKADVVILQGNSNCDIFASAFATLNIKPKHVLTSSACAGKPMAADPAKFAGWTLLSPTRMAAAGPGSTPDITEMLAAWGKYADSKAPGALAEMAWGALVNAATAINAAKPATLDAASVAAALKGWTGDTVIGGGKAECATTHAATCVPPTLTGYDVTATGLKVIS